MNASKKLEYFHRIDPNITREGALIIIVSVENDLPRLRPKARKAALEKLEVMRRDLSKLL